MRGVIDDIRLWAIAIAISCGGDDDGVNFRARVVTLLGGDIPVIP